MVKNKEQKMSRMSDQMIDAKLQDEIRRGQHSFEAIARIYNVPRQWVDLALEEVLEQYRFEDWDQGDIFLNEPYADE